MHECTDAVPLVAADTQSVRRAGRTVAVAAALLAVVTVAILTSLIWVVEPYERLQAAAYVLGVVAVIALILWIGTGRVRRDPAAANSAARVALCPQGVAVDGRLVEWRLVDQVAILLPSRGRADVAIAFRPEVAPTGRPQVARMVPGTWVPTDERLRWLGSVEAREAESLATRTSQWTGSPTTVLRPI